MMKRYLKLHLLILITLFVLCASACSSSSMDNTANKGVQYHSEISDEYDPDTELSVSPSETQRKIIVTAEYHIETKNIDESISKLNSKVSEIGGYVQESYVSGSTEDGGNTRMVLRIPASMLDECSEFFKGLGNILYSSQSGQDITTIYYDTDTQIKSLEIQQDRILALLEKADNLDDILKLESELNRIRTSLEQLKTRLRGYDNAVDYATLTVSISQVEAYTVKNESFGDKVSSALSGSFNVAVKVLKSIVIALIWILPYIVIIGAALLILRFCMKKKGSKPKNDKNSKTD